MWISYHSQEKVVAKNAFQGWGLVSLLVTTAGCCGERSLDFTALFDPLTEAMVKVIRWLAGGLIMIGSRFFTPFFLLITILSAGCSKGGVGEKDTANTLPEAGSPDNGNLNVPARGWLATSGNHIVASNGTPWMGRGVNIHDTRSCGALTGDTGEPLADNATGIAEVKRRIDAATGDWKANFLRLDLESRRTQDNYLNNSAYRALVKEIVDYIGSKPGVYVMVSLWLDTSFDDKGLPTANTNAILEQLAKDFYNYDYVMFGVSNEPQENYDGAQDADVWNKMNAAAATIRKVEDSMGGNHHLVSVQGTREWARYLDYYVTHPITAGNGANVVYETHVYNAPADFDALFLKSGRSIPVVIGEYGPINDQFHKASVQDMQSLMSQANAAGIPYLAWTFHQFCPPNLVADKPGTTWDKNTETDGLGMELNPTDFGLAVKADLNEKALTIR